MQFGRRKMVPVEGCHEDRQGAGWLPYFLGRGDVIMKAVLIIFGSLGGLYAVFGIVQFIRTLLDSNPGTAYGAASIAASVLPVCLGLIVCLVCFQRAFRKPPTT
jgi:hypothetical protein